MKLEGRIALGLDEFMLRLGHLKVLVEVLGKTSGNRSRIGRLLAERLTRPVAVTPAHEQALGDYLLRKKLATVVRADGTFVRARPKARYASLRVSLDDRDCIASLRDPAREHGVEVWFQDFAIADPATRSKVGAVTADTREITNKSGVSHLVDWAAAIGLANRRLGLTALGRAFAKVSGWSSSAPASDAPQNPYVIGEEGFALAWILFAADGDVLTRLILKLAGRTSIVKSDAIELIVEIAQEQEAETSRPGDMTSVAAKRVVRSFREELGIDPRRREGGTSTAWHRVSSRLEALTDLGFLVKRDDSGRSRHYDYYYAPTPSLRIAAESLGRAQSLSEWLDGELLAAMSSIPSDSGTWEPYRTELTEAVILATGPTGVHIDSFALVAATIALKNGKALTPTHAREWIRLLAVDFPDIARLSRGYSGSRAEFASVVLAKLRSAEVEAFAARAHRST